MKAQDKPQVQTSGPLSSDELDALRSMVRWMDDEDTDPINPLR